MCLPNTASRSNHTTTCVHTSPWCAQKVKECIIVICARRRTLCTGSICPFFSCPPICVYHMYLRTHSHDPQHTQRDCEFVRLQTHRPKKKNSNTREGKKKRQRGCVGGRSLETGGGWWSGLHLQVLEGCRPRSLHTCLDTSNHGMFQAQRNTDNQPNARTRAHVRMEICLPRAHLFICLV